MKNNKIYIILSVFALISLFLIVFLIWPLFNEIKKNSQDLISARNSMVTLSAQTSETDKFKKNYDGYKLNFERIDQLFIDPNNPVNFIEFLERTANNSGITSQISLPLSSKESKDFIIFQLSSKGSFEGVLNFLEKIESGPYLIEVGSLNIKNSVNVVDASFTIKAFIAK